MIAVSGTVKGKVLFRDFRPNLKLEKPSGPILAVLDLRTEYLTEIQRRVKDFTGSSEFVLTYYERFIDLLVTEGERYVVAIFSKETDIQNIVDVSKEIRALLH